MPIPDAIEGRVLVEQAPPQAWLTQTREPNLNAVSLFLGTWKTNMLGNLSTAGTTACTVIFRQDHFFVAARASRHASSLRKKQNGDYDVPKTHPNVFL